MSSRNRKPGRNSPWATTIYEDHVADALFNGEVPPTPAESAKKLRLKIERMDYERYDATLKRVYAHPKNLLRLSNRRIADAEVSERNAKNKARYRAAVRRSMRRR